MVLELETRMDLYSKVAEEASLKVISRYSTSFGLASRLLRARTRRHISNFYALVRLADEVVDGVAAEAGVSATVAGEMLDNLEHETERALRSGYSTNLIVHAFAQSARQVGVKAGLTRPFFNSMRMDLTKKKHTQESFDEYVYGSAEVVGLMCLEAFLEGETVSAKERKILVRGARALGAAFQKVNFLRDFGADVRSLGRSYFPGVSANNFDDETKNRLVDEIDADLSVSAISLPLLPAPARPAVALAHLLFQELGVRIRNSPASALETARISVPFLGKLALSVKALGGKVSSLPDPVRKDLRA